MADAERCICCGEIIPEDMQICPSCAYKYGRGQTTETEAKIALQIVKQYCVQRLSQFEECGNCPIKIACLNEVKKWEV